MENAKGERGERSLSGAWKDWSGGLRKHQECNQHQCLRLRKIYVSGVVCQRPILALSRGAESRTVHREPRYSTTQITGANSRDNTHSYVFSCGTNVVH